MGVWFSRPPESLTMGAPPLRTPFTDITAPIGHHDGGQCMPFQLRWVDCVEAYGPLKGEAKCAELYQDFAECAMQWKQLHRVEHIKDERARQWFKGVIGKGPKTNLNTPQTPEPDSYIPNFSMQDP